MDPAVYLSCASDEDHSLFLALNVNYQHAKGRINYLAISTRPVLAFTVSLLSQHLKKPGIQHWWAFKWLLRYLFGTQQHGLTLFCTSINIRTYAYASYANCPTNSRSHTGLLVYLGNTLLHWKSRRQPSVSSSSTEAEYKALYKGGQQIFRFRQLLLDMSFSISSSEFSLLGNKQQSIALAKNPMSFIHTMHINVKLHCLREKLVLNVFTLYYVSTIAMHADLINKALHCVKHQGLVKHVFSSSFPYAELGGEFHNNENLC
ncbi:hypothetical protein O181_087185 [Austropuccinia psidii MF-1]|uniref:Reverse transcriptase Ty1/copia-type domain-containing protein n=1 Tax=Austropuccinia psidii MF-1 TaxID=1389203 RepID=A0A9Q3IP64_9BASI|nr:hypothetical protein [Austropuccinia psidii MF-1]